MSFDDIGFRMKHDYEDRYRFELTRRVPVIIRIDGRSFHSFCKNFAKPYDMPFKFSMWETAKALCEEIMGAKIAYVQSDEISILVLDYSEKIGTAAYFDYNVQKIASVTAAYATMAFNKAFVGNIAELYSQSEKDMFETYQKVYGDCLDKATFDSRVFNIPEKEVCNYFIWRQLDATRNSIQMSARCLFSQKELQYIGTKKLQYKMLTEKNVNWNDYPTFFKRGVCVKKETMEIESSTKGLIKRDKWIIDDEIPIFTQDRDYIERLLKIENV
jgi:tRNA(His) 5'-end guanylyltransferase